MFLREAHEVYRQTQDNPVSFSTLCDWYPKNVLLLADLVEKQNDQDEDESTDNVNEKKHVTKLQCWSKQVYVGEVVELSEASFQGVLVHVDTKRI